MPSLLKVWLFAQSLVTAMAFVPHPRSLGYAVKQFVFSEVPTLIAVWTLRRGALDQFAGRERRARIGAAFLGGASYAFLLAALGS